MTHRIARKLDAGRKLLLVIAGTAAVAGPVVIGALDAPQIRAQGQATVTSLPAFEVASIRPDKKGFGMRVNPLGIEYTLTLRMLIAEAYGVKSISISSPHGHTRDLLDRGSYDVVAKADHVVAKAQLLVGVGVGHH